MSPEKCGVFQLLKIGDFLKNCGVLQLTKMGPFLSRIAHGQVHFWLAGGISLGYSVKGDKASQIS